MATEIDNKRLEDTMALILQVQKKFKDHREVARVADNINHSDVGDWIRQNPEKFHLWVNLYSGIYSMPEVESWWE